MKYFLRMLYWFIIISLSLYLIVLTYIYFSQDQLFFHPSTEIQITPSDVNLAYEDIYITHPDGEKINLWYIPAESDSANTIIFCHGNAGNISNRMETVMYLNTYNVNIVIFDYRGYGKSGGTPSEENCYQDAIATYDWLSNERKVSSDKIIIFGRSLGGAVAIDLASKRKCKALIVESSFSSSLDIGKLMFPYLPTKYLLKYHFDSMEKIKNINVPLLIAHSQDDDIIPYKLGKRLFEAAKEPKIFLDINGTHNDREYFNNRDYKDALKSIFE